MEETPSAKTYLGWAAVVLAGLALLAAVLLALWHVFEWLRDGIWPHLDGAGILAGIGIPRPVLPWPWAQSAIDWILSWSAAFLLTCSSIMFFILGTSLSAEYDRKAAAAKKARGRFTPPTSRAVDLDLDRDEIGEDEDEEEDAPAPPIPPRSFRQTLTDGFLGCGCIVLLLVVGLALFIGWDYFDRNRYNRVSARVLTVARSCVLEGEAPQDPALWEESGRPRSGEMQCDEARRQAPIVHAAVIETMSVTYTYTSPVDGRNYRGALHRDAVDFPPDVRVGGEMPVYSLSAEPSRSRGIYQWPVD